MTRKAIAIYHAPPGDSKVVETNGVTFFDGQAVHLCSDDERHAHLINKLQGNACFEIEIGEDEPAPKRGPGRPPKIVVPE